MTYLSLQTEHDNTVMFCNIDLPLNPRVLINDKGYRHIFLCSVNDIFQWKRHFFLRSDSITFEIYEHLYRQ